MGPIGQKTCEDTKEQILIFIKVDQYYIITKTNEDKNCAHLANVKRICDYY